MSLIHELGRLIFFISQKKKKLENKTFYGIQRDFPFGEDLILDPDTTVIFFQSPNSGFSPSPIFYFEKWNL